MILALTIGVLTAGALYLMLDGTFLRVVLGFVVLSHAANLLLFAAGGTDRRAEPLGSSLDPATVADALPQAFVLTAIVIAFSITVYMLVLSVAGGESQTDEETS
ncbi:sodium:proton antiporter [Aeromicrobium sp. CTD01-1L150]|uniref:sodium:proton antiporter n=1 Tax=Aeromicrobium sp. CTD01-1L150 TaxID=3341830 RepID=UPI0035C0FCF1